MISRHQNIIFLANLYRNIISVTAFLLKIFPLIVFGWWENLENL